MELTSEDLADVASSVHFKATVLRRTHPEKAERMRAISAGLARLSQADGGAMLLPLMAQEPEARSQAEDPDAGGTLRALEATIDRVMQEWREWFRRGGAQIGDF